MLRVASVECPWEFDPGDGLGATNVLPSVMGPTLASSSAALATGIAASRASRPLALTSATCHEEEAQAAATGHEEAQATATGQEKKSATTSDNEQALAEAPSSATSQRRRDDKPLLDPPEFDDEAGPIWDTDEVAG